MEKNNRFGCPAHSDWIADAARPVGVRFGRFDRFLVPGAADRFGRTRNYERKEDCRMDDVDHRFDHVDGPFVGIDRTVDRCRINFLRISTVNAEKHQLIGRFGIGWTEREKE